jgi:hypothetical protein
MNKYCVQCKWAFQTDEQNLYECRVEGVKYSYHHLVCGNTIACFYFRHKESEVKTDG